jgi:hypothetical protein
MCKRPKSREETPKEGSGSARRYRIAIKWQAELENASPADIVGMLICKAEQRNARAE